MKIHLLRPVADMAQEIKTYFDLDSKFALSDCLIPRFEITTGPANSALIEGSDVYPSVFYCKDKDYNSCWIKYFGITKAVFVLPYRMPQAMGHSLTLPEGQGRFCVIPPVNRTDLHFTDDPVVTHPWWARVQSQTDLKLSTETLEEAGDLVKLSGVLTSSSYLGGFSASDLKLEGVKVQIATSAQAGRAVLFIWAESDQKVTRFRGARGYPLPQELKGKQVPLDDRMSLQISISVPRSLQKAKRYRLAGVATKIMVNTNLILNNKAKWYIHFIK